MDRMTGKGGEFRYAFQSSKYSILPGWQNEVAEIRGVFRIHISQLAVNGHFLKARSAVFRKFCSIRPYLDLIDLRAGKHLRACSEWFWGKSTTGKRLARL